MKIMKVLSVVFATVALVLSIFCLADGLDIKIGLPVALGLLALVSWLNAYMCYKEGKKNQMIILFAVGVILLGVGITYIFI